MAVIDKGMLNQLSDWIHGKAPRNQNILYVNSKDRALTSATIRKLMYEMYEEDVHGEGYESFWSAENFYHNMREYFTHIDELYLHHPSKDDSLETIIYDVSPTCGWITLIVEDIETLSDKPEIMQEVIKAIFSFSSRRANIILIGNGDYKEVFSGCEYAMGEMIVGINAKEEDNIVMVGCYDQEQAPDRECVTFASEEDQRDELDFYWDTLYEQLEKRYLDYTDFKCLYKDTMEFLVPRVTKDQVYRKDLWLIENIGRIRHEDKKDIEGCKPWEFETAQKMAKGLHEAIINSYDYNDDFSEGKLHIDVVIEEPKHDYGAIHISGSMDTTLVVAIDNVCQEIDLLAQTIFECTYKGDENQLMKYLCEKRARYENKEISAEDAGTINNTMNSLLEGIKTMADETINKDTGLKVCRHKGNQRNNDELMSYTEDKTKIKIRQRDFDIALDKIRGIEKLNPAQLGNIYEGNLTRYTVLLNPGSYFINDDGMHEMIEAAQEEYDKFIFDIRQTMLEKGFKTLDEGFGEDEDELEWHFSGYYEHPEDNNVIVGVMEIDSCVRIAEESE